MQPTWRETSEAGRTVLRLATGALDVGVVPELGGKVASLRVRDGGFECLWQPPDGRYPTPRYGDVYGPEYATGFDECFPTLVACPYPDEPWQGVPVPDHGEVWALPWEWQTAAAKLILSVTGRAFPYRLTRTLEPEGERSLLFRYELVSLCDSPLRYLWSAHPLFVAREDMHLRLAGSPAVSVFESLGQDLGPEGTRHTWPVAGAISGPVDLSHPGGWTRAADKVFAEGLAEGRVTVEYRELGLAVAIEFPLESVPALGLWYNLRGWPEEAPHYNVGVEPCSTPYERITQSPGVLPARGSAAWWMRWTLTGVG